MGRSPQREKSPSVRGRWRMLALLGVPAFVLALATTVVTTYLPVHLHAGRASTTMIGLLIGAEGLMALIVPLVVGTASDRLRTSLGGRLPFVLAATPPLVIALLLMGLAGNLAIVAGLLVLFFAAYYVGYEPYRALYPDLVEDEIAGQAQSSQAIFRGLGTFTAILGGGLLIALGDAVPFIVAAALAGGGLVAFVAVAARREERPDAEPAGRQGVREAARRLWRMIRERRDLRLYLVANALWEAALGALKTFVVLYLAVGLGYSISTSSLLIGGVALLLLVGSPISGKLGDKYGAMRVLQWALLVYGLGFIVPFLATDPIVVAASVPIIALGGGVVMTLPYAVLIPLMQDEDHGALTGFYSFSRGIGIAVGPILAGTVITASDDLFSSTKGFQAMWGVCAGAVLLSGIPLRRLRAMLEEKRDGAGDGSA